MISGRSIKQKTFKTPVMIQAPELKSQTLFSPRFLTFVLLPFLLSFLLSCSGGPQLQISVPPAPTALKKIASLGVDRITGDHAAFFRVLLNQNIQKSPYFEHVEDLSMLSEQTGLLNAEILLYSVRDEKETRNLPNTQLQKTGSADLSQKGQSRFEFVTKEASQALIHRTLDLKIRIKILSSDSKRTLYENTERVSFQQSYKGERQIQNIPDPSTERLRLGQLLIQRFLDKIAPQKKQKTLVLEKGTSTLPWTFNKISVQHPRIREANREAYASNYRDALKKWHYVLFKPEGFPGFARFSFSNKAYVRFKKEGLPDSIIQKLLRLYGRTFSVTSMDQTLNKLLGSETAKRYAPAIKAHARSSWQRDTQNLSATHYNIALIYRLHKKFKLASYYVARANALHPSEKYAQFWTDVQYEMGSFNPLDSMLSQNIESAGERPPPENAMILPRALLQAPAPVQQASLNLIPVELPQLFAAPETQTLKAQALESATPAQQSSEPTLQLN